MFELKEMISRRLGVDILSRDFLRDPSYVMDRCSRVNEGGPGFQSVLRWVIHSKLSPEDRSRVFPGDFDLGNSRLIQDGLCTYEALIKELEEQRSPEEVLDNPLDKTTVVRLLKDVAGLLGHKPPQEAEEGAGQFFKVAKLIHGFKQRDGLSQLISILQPPSEAKASLELTNPYSTGSDSDLRWNMVDLEGYLSAEISKDRLDEIEETFGEIRSAIDDAIERIQNVLKSDGQPSVGEVIERYRIVQEHWTLQRPPPPRATLRADEQLYVAMRTLDFLHFAKVERRLRSARLLQRSVKPLPVGSLRFRVQLSDVKSSTMSSEIESLHSLLREAINEPISSRQFRDYLKRAHTLLEHWVYLQQPILATEDVDASTALSAIIVAREMLENPASHKPGLHGAARGLSQSVKAAMKPGSPISSTHEEFERIVSYAIQWTRYALAGQTAVLEAQLAFEMRLQEAAVAVLSTHNTDVVDTFISNLKGYSLYSLNDVSRQAAMKCSAQSQ